MLSGPAEPGYLYCRRGPGRLGKPVSWAASARFRLRRQIIGVRAPAWGNRLRRSPLPADEVRGRAGERHERGEALVLPVLAQRASVSGSIFSELALDAGTHPRCVGGVAA